MRLVSREEMIEIDRRSTQDFGISAERLMEHAGAKLAGEIARRFKKAKEIFFVCGKGNNGGDGLVAARILKKRYRIPANIILLVQNEALGGEAKRALDKWLKAGGRVESIPQNGSFKNRLRSALSAADLVVDAVFGTGLRPKAGRGHQGRFFGAIEVINELKSLKQRSPVAILAVDIPSGLDADTGLPVKGDADGAVHADLTLTMGLAKLGMLSSPGKDYCGEIRTATLPFPRELLKIAPAPHELISPQSFRDHLRKRPQASHKGQFGHTLIIGGSRRMPGALWMAVAAALRSGAGKVTAAVPGYELVSALAPGLPEAMWAPTSAASTGAFAAAAAQEISKWLDEHRSEALSIVIGPGMGTEKGAAKILHEVLSRAAQHLIVLDADALNLLAGRAARKSFKTFSRNGSFVLTPHPGELGRLLGVSSREIQANRLLAIQKASRAYGSWIVLKGERSLIASPPIVNMDLPFSMFLDVNPTGNPGMAKGGMGDVLAGILGARLAIARAQSGKERPSPQGIRQAIQAAVYVHGLAGDLACRKKGEESLLPRDVIAALPQAFRRVKRKSN